MSGWESLQQEFTHVAGAALGVVLAVFLGWCAVLATLMVVNGVRDRVQARQDARRGAAPKLPRWTRHVGTDPAGITILLRDTTRDTQGRSLATTDTELTRVQVRGQNVDETRAQLQAAWAEAGAVVDLLNDPFGPDGITTEAEAAVMNWTPPPGYAITPDRALDLRDGWTPPPPVEAL